MPSGDKFCCQFSVVLIWKNFVPFLNCFVLFRKTKVFRFEKFCSGLKFFVLILEILIAFMGSSRKHGAYVKLGN